MSLGGLLALSLVAVQNDGINLDVAPPDPGAVVLYNGRMGSCVENEVVRGWGQIALPAIRKWDSPSRVCVSSVAVFSKDHAAWVMLNPWSDGEDKLQPTLQPRLEPVLNIWVVSSQASDLARVDVDTLNATSIFRDSRVGVSLSGAKTQVTHVQPSTPMAKVIGNACEFVNGLRATGPPVYDPLRINIYYVPIIDLGGEHYRGYNCFEYGAPNLIYISLDDYSEATLAHELGHAFALRGVMGHVPVSSFGKKNLMVDGLYLDEDAERDRFTFGQAYRMNLEESSLLRSLFPAGRVTTWCQDKRTDDWPCPLLALKLAEDGP